MGFGEVVKLLLSGQGRGARGRGSQLDKIVRFISKIAYNKAMSVPKPPYRNPHECKAIQTGAWDGLEHRQQKHLEVSPWARRFNDRQFFFTVIFAVTLLGLALVVAFLGLGS